MDQESFAAGMRFARVIATAWYENERSIEIADEIDEQLRQLAATGRIPGEPTSARPQS